MSRPIVGYFLVLSAFGLAFVLATTYARCEVKKPHARVIPAQKAYQGKAHAFKCRVEGKQFKGCK